MLCLRLPFLFGALEPQACPLGVKITAGGDTVPPPFTLSTPRNPLEQSLQSQAALT